MLTSDARLSVRLPSVMLERLRLIAAAEQRTVNNTIRLALYEWINEQAKGS